MSGGEEEEEREEEEEQLDLSFSLSLSPPAASLLTSANSLRHGTAHSTALAAVAISSSLSPGLVGGSAGCWGWPVAGSTTTTAGTGLGSRLP